jgi:DNA-binding CsgD family transcriptional regulator
VLPPEQHLVSLFGLTTAEAQIVLALLAGKRLEEVAEERAVSLGTVRSQFKSVLRKTEVDRQAELIRSMLAIPVIRSAWL